MPAGAGTPRYEKPELWLGTANWHDGFCQAMPRPQRGTSPRATFSHSAIDPRSSICVGCKVYNSAGFVGGEPASRLIGGHIPDRSPGYAFVPIAHAGWCRHTKVRKLVPSAPPLLDSSFRWNDEFSVGYDGSLPFSYQSPMPPCAGTPRYENPELRFCAANSHGGFCRAQARPQRGTSPRATFFFSG